MIISVLGKENTDDIIAGVIPPSEKNQGYDDRTPFISALAIAIALKDEGVLLLEALRNKWPDAVEKSMNTATKLVLDKQTIVAT